METKTNILELYSRIPDYSEVKHLGNSDFINTLERLKEEFRKCRHSLSEMDSDVEYLSERTSKILNLNKSYDDVPTRDVGGGPDSKVGPGTNAGSGSGYCTWTNEAVISIGPTSKRNNVNVVSPNLSLRGGTNNVAFGRQPGSASAIRASDATTPSALTIKSCSVYKNAVDPFLASKGTKTDRFKLGTQGRRFDSYYKEDYDLLSSEKDSVSSVGGGSGISKWSSSPEIYSGDKEWMPPSHVEKRILARKSQNNSAPSLPDMESKPPCFKANPVPSHIHKPLYDFIVLKNKRRSLRVREKSKQKLLAQVKPFSFCNDKKATRSYVSSHGQIVEHREEPLRSNRSPRTRRANPGVKFSNDARQKNVFRAHPAPPRSKALLAAIKLKEQQDYRELRKRMRAEALMRTASLPPSMEARQRQPPCTAASIRPCHRSRLDDMLQRFERHSSLSAQNRGTSEDTWTDDDPYDPCDSDETYLKKPRNTSKERQSRSESKKKGKKPGGIFTPYGELKFPVSSASSGIFESTSNDNLASRLRVQATKAKELSRIKKEEEELVRLMKMDKKRQRLRDAHFLAWRRAGSYSSSQDIAMRRQLRMAAAILERESYKRDMTSMLSRVNSAPLLLEGVRERRFEPCKKHKEEFGSQSNTPSNKLSSPRRQYYNPSKVKWGLGNDDTEKSETAALAEGSLSNSDNESQPDYDLDLDNEPQVEDQLDSDEENENVTPTGSNNGKRPSYLDDEANDNVEEQEVDIILSDEENVSSFHQYEREVDNRNDQRN